MNTANPYAAPTTLERHTRRIPGSEAQAASAAMYSPSQVAAATFLGGTTAGGILMAANAMRQGRTAEAVTAVLGGLVATVGIVVLALMLPVDLPGMVFLMLSTVAMLGIATAVQGAEYKAHIAAGGETVKGWKPVVIALGTAAVIGGALFATLMMLG